ncbi:response regulator transcription factor [Bradyrhizobium sp. UNPF46]|uniref:helix-turn-helix transcriptional regulator n=1 Tax=Bradyrhizobium sp. UNPF46 TaxID=1141168 RepID=UPI001152F5DA|nr:response regulator transcription factor [Bradyrhizobium sp. UNPF46]
MIDATASLMSAERITAAKLVEYLLATGWSSRPSRVAGVAIFSKRILNADDPVQFVVPVVPSFPEEERRVADALRTLAQIDGSSEAVIVEKLLHVSKEASARAASDVSSKPQETRGILTEREMAIAQLVSHGKANKEIAQRLRLSERTVKVHIHAIMRKLKAANRTEVAAYFVSSVTEADHPLPPRFRGLSRTHS